jgi:hypothetical protein
VVALREKYISNLIEILFSKCAFMRYWVGLYPEITKKMIEGGVNMMMKTTFQMIKNESHQSAPMMMITGTKSQTEEGVADLEDES